MQANEVKTETDWQTVAAFYAEEASEAWSDRWGRGVLHDPDHDVCVLFNNKPCVDDPGLRDRELAEIRAGLQAMGNRELAYATFPDDGYSYAMVIDAGPDREEAIDRLLEDAIRRTARRPVGKGHE